MKYLSAITLSQARAASPEHEDFPEMELFHDTGRLSSLSAVNAENIAIRGGGVTDGSGESWGSNLAPGYTRPRLIVFDHSTHIIMENITVQNSPWWQIVPYYSDDLTFREHVGSGTRGKVARHRWH